MTRSSALNGKASRVTGRLCLYRAASLLTALAVSFFLFYRPVYASDRRGPVIRPAPEIWDLGRTRKGHSPKKTFLLHNTGDEEAAIKSVNCCCGYNAFIRSWNIPPGKTAEVDVSCHTDRKPPGIDTRYITITYNSPDGTELKIPVTTLIIE